MNKQIRQGDVLLDAQDLLPPKDARAIDRVVLALGETTGHAHILTGAKILEWDVNGQRYVRSAGGKGALFHDDYDPLPVAVLEADTTYKVIPQKEWDLQSQWRKVQD